MITTKMTIPLRVGGAIACIFLLACLFLPWGQVEGELDGYEGEYGGMAFAGNKDSTFLKYFFYAIYIIILLGIMGLIYSAFGRPITLLGIYSFVIIGTYLILIIVMGGFVQGMLPEDLKTPPEENDDYTTIPNDAAGYFDLSHRDLAEGVRADISIALDAFGIKTYTSHHEVSDGQHEINFNYSDALTTADRVLTLKYVTKVIARKHYLHASFMPKPTFGYNGSGMHTHLSLFDKKGKNAFYDAKGQNQLSNAARYFIGGLLGHIKEITAILNPTVNSYKRLQ